MSSTRKRFKPNPLDDARTKRLLRCPDCPAHVRLERDSLDDVTAFVSHEPSCPKIPAENRARGEFQFVIINPQLLHLNLTEGETL